MSSHSRVLCDVFLRFVRPLFGRDQSDPSPPITICSTIDSLCYNVIVNCRSMCLLVARYSYTIQPIVGTVVLRFDAAIRGVIKG